MPAESPRGAARGARRPSRRFLLYVGGAHLQAMLLFLYRYLEERVYDPGASALPPLVNELTGAYGMWALLALVVIPYTRRHPLTNGGWRRELPGYVALLFAYSAVHTSSNWALRSLAFPLVGLGSYDYGDMSLRYVMEFAVDAIGFSSAIAIAHLFAAWRRSNEERLRAERLERALTEARLHALRLQLQPHFLFNALNTIASVMYDDVRAADAMLTHLSSLLRASLQTTERQLTSLDAELATLGHYVALLRGRFGDRCTVRVDVGEEVGAALVPALVLQPLVENSVRHGRLSKEGRGVIDVSARAVGERLEIVVQDDGPGSSGASGGGTVLEPGDGVGLRSTADRVRLIYGDAGTLEAGNANGGFRVTLVVPFVTAAAPAGSPGYALPPRLGAETPAGSAATDDVAARDAPHAPGTGALADA